ncbi:MAG: glycosyltransferase [Candidatus Shapirobacteria bacterium]
MPINKIDALIAAYNEEKTIKSVVTVLLKTSHINTIIIVDDGSVDKTSQVVKSIKSPKILLLKMPKNSGKSQAIAHGLSKVTTPNVFLCDADLDGLTPKICQSIIDPITNNRAKMSIGVRSFGVLTPTISYFFPSISGERALNTDILKQCVKSNYFYNYGMETVINYFCFIHKLKTVKRIFKYGHINHIKKDNFFKGLIFYSKQYLLIAKIYLHFLINGWN